MSTRQVYGHGLIPTLKFIVALERAFIFCHGDEFHHDSLHLAIYDQSMLN